MKEDKKRPTLFDFLRKRGIIGGRDSASEEEAKSKEAGTPPVSEGSEGSRRASDISKRASGIFDGIRKALAGLGRNPARSTEEKRKSVAETDTEFQSSEDLQSSAEDSPRTREAERPPMPTSPPSVVKPRTWKSAVKKSQTATSTSPPTAASGADVTEEDILAPTHPAPEPPKADMAPPTQSAPNAPKRKAEDIKQPAVPKKVTADKKVDLAEVQKRLAGKPRPAKLGDQFRNPAAIQAEKVQAAKTETQPAVKDVSAVSKTMEREHNTALHLAVENGNLGDVKKLLTGIKIPKSEALIQLDPNIQNSAGKTALHIAVEKGNLDIVRALLEKNANTEIKDKNGHTPVDIAILNSPIAKVLLDHQQQKLLAETATTEQKMSVDEEKKASPTGMLKQFKQKRAAEGKSLPPAPKSPTASPRVTALKESRTADKGADNAADTKSESGRTFKSR